MRQMASKSDRCSPAQRRMFLHRESHDPELLVYWLWTRRATALRRMSTHVLTHQTLSLKRYLCNASNIDIFKNVGSFANTRFQTIKRARYGGKILGFWKKPGLAKIVDFDRSWIGCPRLMDYLLWHLEQKISDLVANHMGKNWQVLQFLGSEVSLVKWAV